MRYEWKYSLNNDVLKCVKVEFRSDKNTTIIINITKHSDSEDSRTKKSESNLVIDKSYQIPNDVCERDDK